MSANQIAEPVTIGHITITPKGLNIDADCDVCKTGITVPPMFGPIPGETLILEFAKQHLHKPRKARR